MSKPAGVWTSQALETLKQMSADGHSAEAIGRAINKTRNAVLGKFHRLHLARTVKPVSVFRPNVKIASIPAAVVLASSSPWPVPRCRVALPFSPPGGPIHFLKLRPHHCRAIVGSAADGYSLSCGKRKDTGSAWCVTHRKLFTTVPKEYRNGQTSSDPQHV